MPVPTLPNAPAWTYTQSNVSRDPFVGGCPSTVVAPPSSGTNVSTFTGSTTLYVPYAGSAGFPADGSTIAVQTSAGTAYLSYSSITSGTGPGGQYDAFSDCTLVTGSGTVATGGSVTLETVTDDIYTYYTQAQNCIAQLSDGTCVFAYLWDGTVFLFGTVRGHAGVQVLGSYTPAGEAGVKIVPAGMCLCVDASDNIYIACLAWTLGASTSYTYVLSWERGSTQQTSYTVSSTSTSYQYGAPQSMCWVTGGYLLLVTTTFVAFLNASTLDEISESEVPDQPSTYGRPTGLAPAGLGATSGIVVYGGWSYEGDGDYEALQAATWSVSSGALTLGSPVTVDSSSDFPGGSDLTLPALGFAPHVRYVDAAELTAFVIIYVNSVGDLMAAAVDTALAYGGSYNHAAAPSVSNISHLAADGYGCEVGSYTITNYNDGSSSVAGQYGLTTLAVGYGSTVWVVTRSPVTPSALQRQAITVTPDTSPPTFAWSPTAYPIASGMDTSGKAVLCPGDPRTAQVDVVLGCVPGAVNAYCVQGSSVLPPYQPAAPDLANWGLTLDPASAQTFYWVYDVDEGQAAFAFCTQPWPGGPVQYYTGSTWSQFENWLTSGSTDPGFQDSETIGTGQFQGGGTPYGWFALSRNNQGIVSQQPFAFLVTFETLPTLSTPTLVADDTSWPAINFELAAIPVVPINSYQVTLKDSSGYTIAQSLVVSEPVTSSTAQSYQLTFQDFANINAGWFGLTPGSYEVTIEVGDANGGVGSVTADVTVAYTEPATPTLTATPQADGSYIDLVLSGGTADNVAEFQVSLDGGTTWADVQPWGLDGYVEIMGPGAYAEIGSDGTASFQDYVSPGNLAPGAYIADGPGVGGLFGYGLLYRCRQIGGNSDGPIISEWSANTDAVYVAGGTAWTGYWWLKDPNNPEYNAHVQVMPPWDMPVQELSTAYEVLGAGIGLQQWIEGWSPGEPYPSLPALGTDQVVSDDVRGPKGSITFVTITPEGSGGDYDALLSLLIPANVLLLQSPYGDSYFMWLSGARDVSLAFSPIDIPYRLTKCDYVNVSGPDAVSVPTS